MSAIVNGKGTVGIRGGAVVGAPIITQFITTWKTDNAGSATNTIIIPTTGSGYACTVDWGDGTTSTYSGTAPSITHTYSSIGTYTVKISGTFPRIYFNNAGDKLKLLTIEYWGNIAWTSMANAFYGCLNLKLNAPDVPNLSACSDTSYMFCNTKLSGNLNLSGWNTSNVTLMYAMFNGFTGSTSLNLSNWDVSKVTNLGSTQGTGMFGNSKLTDINVSNWTLNTTSNVTAHSMFYNCTVLTGVTGINTWNTSKITTMIYMFNACTLLPTLDLSNWNLSSCTNFNTMFQASGVKNLNLSNWILPTSSGSSVTMNQMFISCASLSAITGLNTWNTSRVTDMFAMFASSPIQTLDLTGWNMSACTTTGSMFQNNLSLKSVNLTGWSNLSNVITASNMFYNCGTLSSITGTQNWNLSKVTTTSSMFSYCTQLRSLDLSGLILNTTTPIDLSSMFYNSTNLSAVTGINNWNTSKVTSINAIVQATKLPSLDLSGWNMSACTSMVGAFASNSSLTAVTGINSWNTSKVTSTQAMFQSCTVLKDLDVTGWNMSANTSMTNMFANCSVLSGITGIENWNLRSSGVTLTGIFASTGLSTAKYTGIIVGWANYVNTNGGSPSSVNMLTQTGRVFQNSQPGGAGFANAGAARTYLTGTLPTGRGWTIGDAIIA